MTAPGGASTWSAMLMRREHSAGAALADTSMGPAGSWLLAARAWQGEQKAMIADWWRGLLGELGLQWQERKNNLVFTLRW
jgi:hypothetical protein